MKIRKIQQSYKNLKYKRVRCDICKIDIHRTSYSRHLKSMKHLEKISQNKVVVPRRNPMKRVVREQFKVPDFDIKKKLDFILLIEI